MKNTTPPPDLADIARDRWPAELVTMLDVAAHALAEAFPKEQAENAAIIAVASIAHYYGGRMFYLPKGKRLEIALRDREIYHQYQHTRGSIVELAEKHDMTEQAIYRIVSQQRALHTKKAKP